MAWRQQDFILRMIEQAGAALRRAIQLRGSGEPAAALDELERASAEVLGAAAPLVSQVDAESAVNIVGDARRLALWSRLLAEEAAVHESTGDAQMAADIRVRALHVAHGALRLDDGVRDEVAEIIRTLER